MLIGRDKGCDLCLPHETVSSNHALVTSKGKSIAIKDLDSTNGTIVAGRPLQGRAVAAREDADRDRRLPPRADPRPRASRRPRPSRCPKQVIRFDERDRGVVNAILADWTDPDVQAPAARGAEEVASDLHCSRQEANRRIARLEQKLGLEKGERGAARYRRLAEELLRRGFGPERA